MKPFSTGFLGRTKVELHFVKISPGTQLTTVKLVAIVYGDRNRQSPLRCHFLQAGNDRAASQADSGI